ncbi:hypothetical protein F5B20DRAFT_541686 [Whalleya microplaca]|nr:hypothetical protein F5B20DRAFT_541686 [Whalleya microplaca]
MLLDVMEFLAKAVIQDTAGFISIFISLSLAATTLAVECEDHDFNMGPFCYLPDEVYIRLCMIKRLSGTIYIFSDVDI